MIENPRVRLALAERGRLIALVLAVVGAALLVLAIWMVMVPTGESVPQQTDQQTIETELNTAAEVTSPDAPWPEDTRLENHPAYLVNATPTMEVGAETAAPEGSTVEHRLTLRTTVERDEGVVWENETLLAAEEATVEDGTVTTTASVNVSEHRQRLETRQREFAGVGTVQSTLLLRTAYDTGTYEDDLAASPQLAVTERAYWIEGERADSRDESRTVTVEQDPEIDWSTVLVLVVLGGLAVAGAAGAATYRVEADLDAIRQQLHRQRYDDWISDGTIPMGVGDESVALDTLKDVVDVAIDTNQRVVYDRRRDVFAVITGDVVYYYSREGDWNRTAWPAVGGDDEESPSFLEAFGMGDEDVEEPPAGESGQLDPAGDASPFSEGSDGPTDGESSPFEGSDGGETSLFDDSDAGEPSPFDADTVTDDPSDETSPADDAGEQPETDEDGDGEDSGRPFRAPEFDDED